MEVVDDAEVDAEHVPAQPALTSPGPAVAIDSTTELRWFVDGALPDEILRWFTQDGAIGLIERRSDTYLVDGQVDVGVKRRNGVVLELKRREGEPEAFGHAECSGWLERWQRWSPADHLVHRSPPATWLDVEKQVIKRRFDGQGREEALTEQNRAMTGQGCDVEIAVISAGGRSAWTFAFAAFGPAATRRVSIESAWQALAGELPALLLAPAQQPDSCGYPQWVLETTARGVGGAEVAADGAAG